MMEVQDSRFIKSPGHCASAVVSSASKVNLVNSRLELVLMVSHPGTVDMHWRRQWYPDGPTIALKRVLWPALEKWRNYTT